MSQKIIIPSAANVSPTFEMLFGDDLEVSTEQVETANDQAEYVAIYIDDNSVPVAACGCDPLFAAYSGASLSRIPADVAKEAAESNDLSSTMSDNFYEVMNICSKLLMDDHSTHLKLDKVKPKAEVSDCLGEMHAYANFQIDIPRYGAGKLAFFTTAEL